MNAESTANATWAIIMIVAVPAVVIAAAELEERLRQRDSDLQPAVRILRNWALPFFAIWALLVPVLGASRDSLGVMLAASGMVLAISASVLSLLRVIVADIRDRPRTEGSRPVPQLLLALPRLAAIIATGWILISTVWGVDLSAALTALGVTSLVVSFALQDTLSGLASGVLLLSDPPFRPGDWIESGEVEGIVVDVNWRTTRIRDRNGDVITVPNSQLASAEIVNYTSPDNLHRVQVDLQVAYVNAPTLAKAMLLDAAKGTPGVLEDPPPVVRVVQIDDPLMGYEVQMWIDDYAIAPRVKSDFGSLVWYQSHRHGVPLPSPAQDLYLYDGVAAGEADVPTLPEVRELLRGSPILSSLRDDDLDVVAHNSQVVRFAVGELMLDSRVPSRDLLVVAEGRAKLIFTDHAAADETIGEIVAGDLVDLVTSVPRDGRNVALRAMTDCEVVVVDADVLGEVGSRNAEVAEAFNRMSAIRRRRIERLTPMPPPATTDAESETS